MPKVNPFKPFSPVPHGLFVGRIREIDCLEAHLAQTKAGHPSSFMVTGERGIGKSSLLLFVRFVAQGGMDVDGGKLNYLVIDTDIDARTTQFGLVRKIEFGLRSALAKSEPAREFLKKTWEFLQRIQVQGTGFKSDAGQKSDELMLEEFSYSLAQTCDRVCGVTEDGADFGSTHDGVLILIDEADNASKDLQLGSFLKLLNERLQRRGCDRVMFGLAGLSGLRDVLRTSHPSSLRMFEELPLDRLSNTEVGRVVELCLKRANETADPQIEITSEAEEILVLLAEGYPHFIQQFGYSAFAVDSDDIIDGDDVRGGALGKGGALERIGDRYYRDDFYNRIQKDNYRQVLRIMADSLDDWVTKQAIRDRFKGKQSALDNAIYALRDRHIIQSKEGVRGVYRLRHKGFALWIKYYTTDPDDVQQTLNGDGDGVAEGGTDTE